MKEWQKIIRQLQAEQRMSERELARRTRINRSTLRRAFSGRSRIALVDLETMLLVFGYHLTAVSHDGEYFACPPLAPASVAGKSSPLANAANAKSNGTKSAKPASIKLVRPHAKGDTATSGSNPVKPSSPSTGHV